MNLLQHKINRREFEPTKAHPERSVQHSGTEHVLTNCKLMFFKTVCLQTIENWASIFEAVWVRRLRKIERE